MALPRGSGHTSSETRDGGRHPPLLGDVVFHCQQAVEKYFKTLLAWRDMLFRKTHSLEELGEACLSLDTGLKALVDRAAPLSEYAWKFRYPGEADEPSMTEVEEALAVAVAVRDAVVQGLPAEFHGDNTS